MNSRIDIDTFAECLDESVVKTFGTAINLDMLPYYNKVKYDDENGNPRYRKQRLIKNIGINQSKLADALKAREHSDYFSYANIKQLFKDSCLDHQFYYDVLRRSF